MKKKLLIVVLFILVPLILFGQTRRVYTLDDLFYRKAIFKPDTLVFYPGENAFGQIISLNGDIVYSGADLNLKLDSLIVSPSSVGPATLYLKGSDLNSSILFFLEGSITRWYFGYSAPDDQVVLYNPSTYRKVLAVDDDAPANAVYIGASGVGILTTFIDSVLTVNGGISLSSGAKLAGELIVGGNAGFGVSSSSLPLSVGASIAGAATLMGAYADDDGWVYSLNKTENDDAYVWYYDGSGNVDISFSTAAYSYLINGLAIGSSTTFDSMLTVTGGIHTTGGFYTEGDISSGDATPDADLDITRGESYSHLDAGDAQFTTSSDIKLKTNVRNLPEYLDKFLKIKPIDFQWKSDVALSGKKKAPRKYGFSAQDFNHVLFGEKEKTEIDWNKVTVIHWKVTQELAMKVENQQKEINALKITLNELMKKMENLEKNQ